MISISVTQTVLPLKGGHHLAGKENMNITELVKLRGDVVGEGVLRKLDRQHQQGGKAQETQIFALKTALAPQEHP